MPKLGIFSSRWNKRWNILSLFKKIKFLMSDNQWLEKAVIWVQNPILKIHKYSKIRCNSLVFKSIKKELENFPAPSRSRADFWGSGLIIWFDTFYVHSQWTGEAKGEAIHLIHFAIINLYCELFPWLLIICK